MHSIRSVRARACVTPLLLCFATQSFGGEEPQRAPAPLRVLNFEDGDTIAYPVPLLRGAIDAGGPTALRIVNTSSDRPTRELTALVHGGKFKALTELVPGPNRLLLCAGGHELALTLVYAPQKNPRVIRVFYLTDRDGDTAYQTTIEGDRQDFAAKLDTAFKLFQCFTAETLNDAGMGRATFNLELGTDGRVDVHVHKGERTAEEYYALDDGVWWSCMFDEIQRARPHPSAKNVAIPAYTRFDPTSKRVRGHTALGGGDFALFGGGALFTWPSTLADVFQAFADTRPVDGDRVHDDSAGRGTFWGLASTTMGAALHEAGHTLDLPHSSDPFDIMSRGFDHFNRFFTFVEPPSRGGGDSLVFVPDQAARFALHNATALRAHRWFALDDRAFRDTNAPRLAYAENPGGLKITAPNGLRFLGIDAGGDTVGHRAFWDGAAPTEFFLPAAEIPGAAAGNAHFRVTDNEGLMASARWSSLAPVRDFVRAWHFYPSVAEWTATDAFVPVDAAKLAAIASAAAAAPLVTSDASFIDFARTMPARTSAVAGYAFRTIRTDQARRVKVFAGSDDALRVWLNEKLVIEALALRAAEPDQDSALLDLVAGENRLLVEVSQADGGWGLYLRLEDENGRKLELTDKGELRTIEGRRRGRNRQ